MGKDSPSFLKIAYFDEAAAQDYLDITKGGRLDWSKEENKKRVAEILAEIEAQAKGGFNIISFLKGSISGNIFRTLALVVRLLGHIRLRMELRAYLRV